MRDLPSGTVTFLFTDIEGSTRLLHDLGPERYAAALAEHRRVVREAFRAHGGVEVDTQGDAFFIAFPTAQGALAAAQAMVAGLAGGPIRLRMGLHTGTPHLAQEGYVGEDVHRAARIAACGHGGQVLVSAATAALVGTDRLRDLGEHRLKDLSAPERIHQLGSEDFPPLNSLHRTNLPVPATTFLGRERELAEIGALLARPDVRLLTLTGPGGTGKTRLALQAAAAAADRFPDGVWWVPLAALRDPQLLLEAVAQVLGAKGDLAAHIGDKRLLVVLDNFEQVIEAASGLARLLGSCPHLRLIVTSRELLAIPGERAYPVAPLEPREGVELFLERARATSPDFQADRTVVELCARLDNLPLALELAAARVRMLSPEQLLARLATRLDLLKGGRGVDPRQQTLRATIEWSHDLLSPDERTLFARLAVFRGGCTLEAAEQICDADLDTLQGLVDKSLVRRRGERFSMLETIREFAAERLEASGEADALRTRHAEHFLALAEAAGPHLEGDPREGLARLDPEHDNLRAALDHLTGVGETQEVLRLVAALGHYWPLRAHLREGGRRFEDALAADDRPTLARARALTVAARFAAYAADLPQQRRRAEEAFAIFTGLGDERGAARARYALGDVAAGERRWAEARDLLEASVREFSRLGDSHYELMARRGFAWMCAELGDHARSREVTEENLALARAVGHRRIEARSLAALAMIALDDGRIDDAVAMLTDSYRIDRDLGNLIFVSVGFTRFAKIHARRGDHAVAVQLLARGEALREEIGWTPESWVAEEHGAALAEVRAALDDATIARAWERGRALTLDEAAALGLTDAKDA